MASSLDNNTYLSGTSGEVFLNNTQLIEINKIQLKLTGSFEDFSPCGDYASHHVYQGWDGEGTLEGARIDTGIDSDLIDAYTNGIMPEYKIYSNLTNPSTGATEKYMVTGVQFTEITPADWESKTMVKRSMPFTFNGIKVLSTID